MLADSHVHFFSPGFAEALPVSCRRSSPDELTLYKAFRELHDIKAVLAVGFQGLPAHEHNNDYLASIVSDHDWLYPLAYVKPTALNVKLLEARHVQKFIGLSLYLLSDQDAADLATVNDDAWAWLAEHQALVSVNTRGKSWEAWVPILKRHPKLRLMVSHLGLPGKWASVPSSQEVTDALAAVTALAVFPEVRVKFSAFYATSEPYYDFPHAQAVPVMEHLAHAFGVQRLVWGSDFCPALEYVSFPQTFAVLDRWTKVSGEQRDAIKANNLLALIDETTMGRDV